MSRAIKSFSKCGWASEHIYSRLYKVWEHTCLQLVMQGTPMNRASLNSYKLCAFSMLNALATRELRCVNCRVLQEWGGCICVFRAWQVEELSVLASSMWMMWDTNRLKLWEACELVISGSDTHLQALKAVGGGEAEWQRKHSSILSKTFEACSQWMQLLAVWPSHDPLGSPKWHYLLHGQ